MGWCEGWNGPAWYILNLEFSVAAAILLGFDRFSILSRVSARTIPGGKWDWCSIVYAPVWYVVY